jgi:arginine/glutamate-rich protein 1
MYSLLFSLPPPCLLQTHTIFKQDEERLLMVEQKRRMEEERRALEKAQKKAIKAQQDVILNRKGGRQRLSFTVTPKTE